MSGLADPWSGLKVAVASDTDLRRGVGSGIYVWTDGNLKFTTMEGDVIGPYAVVAGQVIPCRVRQINTGTTATVTVGY